MYTPRGNSATAPHNAPTVNVGDNTPAFAGLLKIFTQLLQEISEKILKNVEFYVIK